MTFNLEQFKRDGWSGPFDLLAPEERRRLLMAIRDFKPKPITPRIEMRLDAEAFSTAPWIKSLHAHLPSFHDLAAHPAIVDKIRMILGEDIIAWGVSIAGRSAGEVHRWHVDAEHRRWKGVSVFLGLHNVVPGQSNLKFVCGSHTLDIVPQEHGVDSDHKALALASSLKSDCTLAQPEMSDGQFVIFDGLAWHGSHNTSGAPRFAIILQYCRPSEEVLIPLNWNEPIVWHAARPPCTLVSGKAEGSPNRIVGRPEPFSSAA